MKRIPVEVYSRCCGYFRPVKQWNHGKKAEFKDRLCYDVPEDIDEEIRSRKSENGTIAI